jgi:hypothetical protein
VAAPSPDRSPLLGPPRWRRRLATARGMSRLAGARGVAYLLLQRAAPSPWVHPEWFVVLEHRTGTVAGADAGMRWGTIDDLPRLLAGERDEPVLRERFARGDRVALIPDGDLVAYAWYRHGVYDENGILFRMPADTVWGYDGWVAEHYRRQGLYTALLRGVSRSLAEEGIHRVLLGIDHLNEPSLRAARAGGRVPIGSIWMLRVLGVSLRREAWAGERPRWCLYRGAREVALPELGTTRRSWGVHN